MAGRKTRLELTWIGKDERPRLEPRILLEDPELSYHADMRVSEDDIFDNMLIHGDNLLALKALEQEYAGKVKCIYIDPPYNTGNAFGDHYDDGVEHSLWLSLIRARLEALRDLLSPDGSIWISIDDAEAHYLKVLCDEVFGRSNFIATIVCSMNPKGRQLGKFFAGSHEYVFCIARDKSLCAVTAESEDEVNLKDFPKRDKRGPFRYLPLRNTNKKFNPETRPNLHYPVYFSESTGRISASPLADAISILPEFGDGKPAVWRWGKEKLEREWQDLAVRRVKRRRGGVVHDLFQKDYCKAGRTKKLKTVWLSDAIGSTDHAKEEVRAFNPTDVFPTPKPERLLERIIATSTKPGDIVLDSFLGSGTTSAVAHKMGRRWIGIELGEHAKTHCLPRLRQVVDGTDTGGVTESSEWKGGGGFRFYRLAPSLLARDKWGNWVVSKEYDGPKLAEAMCKLHGFRYDPDPEVFWLHGRSTETDFLYVTDQTLTADQLRFISDEVGPERSLLICCRAWRAKAKDYDNLTLEKIPQSVLSKCEWGRDDYSLNVQDLTPDVASSQHDDDGKPKRKKRKPAVQELPLFAGLSKGGDQ